MVYGRFGFYATFHDIKKDLLIDDELAKVVEENKYAKVIVFRNHVLMPIEQFGVVHGYVKIENGIKLKQNQITQVSDLSDLLVKTMVVSEKNKRIQLVIEDIIQNGLEYQMPDAFCDTKKVDHLTVLKPNLPTLILATTHSSAKGLALTLHNEYKNRHFITVDESNMHYFIDSESINNFKSSTIYIPELADLEKQPQLAFEILLKTNPTKAPKIVASTIFNPVNLIEKQIVRKELLCALSSNRILNPEDECKLKTRSVFTKYLLESTTKNTSKISLWPSI